MSLALDNTMGCLFLSSALSMALWGAGSVQTYYYYNKYENDALWLKLLVATVWFLDTAHQALLIAAVYKYLVTNYADVTVLAYFEPSLKHTVILTTVICLLVQSLFVTRIYHVSRKSIWCTGVAAILVLAQFASSLVYYVKEVHFTQVAELTTIFTVTRTINVITAVADTVIALMLVYFLHNSRTGIRQTDSLLNKLILFAVNTGLITSIDSICSLVTGLALPSTYVYITFYETLARLYMNSMLASLNSRRSLKGTLFNSDSANRAYSVSNDGQTGNRVNLNILNTNSKNETPGMQNAVTVTVERESFEELGQKPYFNSPA